MIFRYIEIFRSTGAEVRRVRLNNLMRMERDIPSLFDRGGPRGGSGRNSRNIRGEFFFLILESNQQPSDIQ